MRRLLPVLLLATLPAFADNCVNLPAKATLSPNGLEQTPVMGYSTWFDQFETPTEAHIKTQSDLLVSTGLAAAGYTQVEVSEGWQGTRVGSNPLPANPTNFPDGLAGTIAYIHGDGLKATAYTSPNITSCGGSTGSGLHEQVDANMFAAAGADRLEYDGCNIATLYPSCWATSGPQVWQYMSQFIRASGRNMPIMIGDSTGAPDGWYPQAPWAKDVGVNEWRITLWTNGVNTDMNGNYALFNGPGGMVDQAALLSPYVQPGYFGHCDYIVGQVENPAFGTFTTTQTQTQFGMCAMWNSPLILSMDISTLTGAQITMFKNPDVIAMDQDSAGRMATRFSKVACGGATCEVWVKPLHDGTFDIGLLNRDTSSQTISVNLAQFGGNPAVRDIWAQSNLGNMTSYSTTVVGDGLALIKVTPSIGGAYTNESASKSVMTN